MWLLFLFYKSENWNSKDFKWLPLDDSLRGMESPWGPNGVMYASSGGSVCYLLLKTANTCHLIDSVGQELGTRLVGWLWLRVYQAVGWGAVIWKLDWGWRICFLGDCLMWLLAESLSFLLHGPPHRLFEHCSSMAAKPPPECMIPDRARRKPCCLLWTSI